MTKSPYSISQLLNLFSIIKYQAWEFSCLNRNSCVLSPKFGNFIHFQPVLREFGNFPVFEIWKGGKKNQSNKAIALSPTCILQWLQHTFHEKPCLRIKFKFSNPLLIFSIITIICIICKLAKHSIGWLFVWYWPYIAC